MQVTMPMETLVDLRPHHAHRGAERPRGRGGPRAPAGVGGGLRRRRRRRHRRRRWAQQCRRSGRFEGSAHACLNLPGRAKICNPRMASDGAPRAASSPGDWQPWARALTTHTTRTSVACESMRHIADVADEWFRIGGKALRGYDVRFPGGNVVLAMRNGRSHLQRFGCGRCAAAARRPQRAGRPGLALGAVLTSGRLLTAQRHGVAG